MLNLSLTSLYTQAFLRLLFPEICVFCRKRLHLLESVLCTPCVKTLNTLEAPVCPTCARPVPPYLSDGRPKKCNACRRDRTPLKALWASVPFDEMHRTLLHRVKFRKERWVLKVYESILRKTVEHIKMRGQAVDGLVPVPMDPLRKREREFNQAEELAHMLARKMNCPVLGRVLYRHAGRAPQSTLKRSERLHNLKGQFITRNTRQITDKHILLVDDIYTTGTTLRECAGTLLASGASAISAFVLARAVPGEKHFETVTTVTGHLY